MTYTLLTGSTGLLGGYLLRDLLVRGKSVAVIVRSKKREDANTRIESVLRHWEQAWARALPRPIVFEGDINAPLLGLDSREISWLGDHCESILHSAASLSFQADRGEPQRSNVGGVQNILELCRTASIRQLHHVSTAYVCGLRQSTVYEDELPEGQEFANVYEQSKAEAEKLIRQSDVLESYTIYRPSIITGDSQTGYTSTFHGFYTPLRVLQTLQPHITVEQMLQANYLSALGMSGEERKNFVPVDWVSDAILTIAERQQQNNQVYSITSADPVRVDDLRLAFEQAIRDNLDGSIRSADAKTLFGNTSAKTPGTRQLDLPSFEREFTQNFSVYESYWREDARFDRRNTERLLPDKPCPQVDRELLMRLCRFALDSNFGFPKKFYSAPEFSASQWLRGRTDSRWSSLSAECTLTLICTGAGGGEWTIGRRENGALACCPGNRGGGHWLRIRTSQLHRIVAGLLLPGLARDTGVLATSAGSESWQLFEQLVGEFGDTESEDKAAPRTSARASSLIAAEQHGLDLQS
jgi:thioester reductase-like protein